MKISVAIIHYNRLPLLKNTLRSIVHSSFDKSELEIIIVDDVSDQEHSVLNIPNLFPELNFKLYEFKKRQGICPVITINKAISMATGDVVVLLCAECMLIGDVLSDIHQKIQPNNYLVYATYSLNQSDTQKLFHREYVDIVNNLISFEHNQWKHHSQDNSSYNYCSAITRSDLMELGGFDERFSKGSGHGDDDFLFRVRNKKMNFILIDFPMAYHQFHEPVLEPMWLAENSHSREVVDVNASLLMELNKLEPQRIKANNSFLTKNNHNDHM